MDLTINGKTVTMEVDTGAAVSLVSEETKQRLFPSMALRKSSVRLQTYTAEQMVVRGELQVEVAYGTQSKTLTLIIVAGNGPSLLGPSWLKHLCLDWQRIASVTCQPKSPPNLTSLLERYEDLFREELGTVCSFKAKLQVRTDAKPKFCKARPVPFLIKEAIELELQRLESSGILKPVTHSEWAAPIVVVPKKNGRFRLCGDYKVTANPVLDIDQYPLPKPDDLFASLAGGERFTKLDLLQAYMQLLLDEESAKYLTVNTHRGLYRLPFGVALAPALF